MKHENHALQYQAVAPSNIALIKYWGKRSAELQWPANDNLSMSLSEACTTTTVGILPVNTPDRFRLGDRAFEADHPKAKRALAHVARLREKTGFVETLAIDSINSFPESCGIASSASGFAALTIACIGAWTRSPNLKELSTNGYPAERLADLARQGSGSACRSLFGGFVRWHAGNAPDKQSYEPLYEPTHWPLADIILLAPAEKSVSSTAGHAAALTSPLFAGRQALLPTRLEACVQAIKSRRMADLGDILESEALEMHAVMESSTPPIRYLSDETRRLLDSVRELRRRGGFPAWFTLDAGETIHLICESRHAPQIVSNLRPLAPSRSILADHVGDGPTLNVLNGVTK